MAAPATSEPRSARQPAPPAHDPYVPDSVDMAEFTWSAVLVGAVLGIVFGASSLYLVLKVGLTVSASIPVAVLSITLFRGLLGMFGIRRPRFWKTISFRLPARPASRSPLASASRSRP